jgi:RNA polymerase sigma-70 factor, ECF subfamily
MAGQLRLLVEKAQGGDSEAVSDLFGLYRGRVIRFCLTFVRLGEADAHDITQEVFVRAFRGIGNLRETDRFESWLFSIARRRCLTHLGRLKKRRDEQRRMALEQEGTFSRSPESEQMKQEELDIVAEEIERMPESSMKEAGRRFYLKGEDTGTIAEGMEAPVSTVTTWLSRFRARIRKRLVLRLLSLRGHAEETR